MKPAWLVSMVLAFVMTAVAFESGAAPRAKRAAKSSAAAESAKPAEPSSELLAIQSDLAWTGDYNGAVNGEPGERTTSAIKAFQKRFGGRASGTLSAPEREALAGEAKKLKDHAGWKLVDDANGARLGIPSKLAPNQSAGESGSKWSSAQGQIQIETWSVKGEGVTLASIAERERKRPAGRKADYAVTKPDFFVLSGLQGLKRFYVRGQFRNGEVRGLTILYDQATEGIMTPVVVAMSSAFAPFPRAEGAPLSGPPPRRAVEYATGIVADLDGAILTDAAAIEGCGVVVAQGLGYGETVATDKTGSLALVRVLGARGLAPMGLARRGDLKAELSVVGIADPREQHGGRAVDRVTVRAAQTDSEQPALTPAPALGFSGAAVFDNQRMFVGMVTLRPVQTAGPPPAAVTARIVPTETVRAFLSENGVTVTASPADPKDSVVRLICVRK